jgi:hypothetical protein
VRFSFFREYRYFEIYASHVPEKSRREWTHTNQI